MDVLDKETGTFPMLVCGMTGCGKTHYMLNHLEKKLAFNYFDYIFTLCPTLAWNRTDQKWKY